MDLKTYQVTVDLGAGYTKKMFVWGHMQRPNLKARCFDNIPITSCEMAEEHLRRLCPDIKIVDVEVAPEGISPPVCSLGDAAKMINGKQ